MSRRAWEVDRLSAVVVAAHSGPVRIVSARQLWDAIPFAAPMTVRFWGVNPPDGYSEESVAEWLSG